MRGLIRLLDHSLPLADLIRPSCVFQSCSPELTVALYNEDGELLYQPLLDRGLAELE